MATWCREYCNYKYTRDRAALYQQHETISDAQRGSEGRLPIGGSHRSDGESARSCVSPDQAVEGGRGRGEI